MCSRDKASQLGEKNRNGKESFLEKEELDAFGPVFDKSIISTSSRKTREVVFQPFMVGAFAVRITKHKIICMLQQSVV